MPPTCTPLRHTMVTGHDRSSGYVRMTFWIAILFYCSLSALARTTGFSRPRYISALGSIPSFDRSVFLCSFPYFQKSSRKGLREKCNKAEDYIKNNFTISIAATRITTPAMPNAVNNTKKGIFA